MINSSQIFDPSMLEALIAVAETRSFTDAARILKRSQSTISASIRRLEGMVGCTLVNRTTRTVLLTNEGEEMVRYARTVIDLSRQVMRRLSQPNCADTVRLGVFTDFDSPLMTVALSAFRALYEEVQVTIDMLRSDLLLGRMRDGELDIVLATRQQGHGFGTALWQDELVWVGTRMIPKTLREPIPLAVRVRPSMLRRLGIEALNVARRPHVIAFEGNSYQGVAAAVRAGMGISVFPHALRPAGLPILDPLNLLPRPGTIDFVLLKGEGRQRPEVESLYNILHDLSPALFHTAGPAMFGGAVAVDDAALAASVEAGQRT